MESTHHPHFFECLLERAELSNYQLRIKEGDHERVTYDPYAFRSPLLTDFDIHLFAEGNHHRIYEKLGAHLTESMGSKVYTSRFGHPTPETSPFWAISTGGMAASIRCVG
jgi:hypothetical protein